MNRQKYISYTIRFILISLAVLASLKTLILGMSIDEEYAITMSYRMVSGDRMFMEMWEPHQTSGFLGALFVALYIRLTGGTVYLGLFLRVVGLLIQGLISLFVYRTIKPEFSETAAFYAGLATFVVSPKWIQAPDFSNLLLWCSLCSVMCLIRFARRSSGFRIWLVLAALFYCGCILAYPTGVFVLPVLIWGIYSFSDTEKNSGDKWKNPGIFVGTCVLTGIGYLAYFLSHMTISELVQGISQMMIDGKHTETLLDKIIFYGRELRTWMIPLFIILAIGLLLMKKLRFIPVLMLASIIEQGIYWFLVDGHVHSPYLFYYILFLAGFYYIDKKSAMFRLVFLPTAAIWFSALMLTCTGLLVTGAYLFPGILATCLYVSDGKDLGDTSDKSKITRLVLPAFAILLLLAKGLIVAGEANDKLDPLYVKQKALSGPAKNIYYCYMDGYAYNNAAVILSENVTSEDCLLAVGQHSLYYMLTDCTIGTYSTISTPTYDERLLEYWDKYPDHRPNKVLVEEEIPYSSTINQYLPLGEIIASGDGINLYSVCEE